MLHKNLFINNQWLAGEGTSFKSINPADGSTVWESNSATPDQVGNAIMAAQKAGWEWSQKTLDERIEVIKKFEGLVRDNKEKIAEIIYLSRQIISTIHSLKSPPCSQIDENKGGDFKLFDLQNH